MAQNLHNYRKIGALYYLHLLKRAKVNQRPRVAEIARMAGTGAKSMGCLLNRWQKWGLVTRYIENDSVYSYELGAAGARYLRQLHKWYSDYYDVFIEVAQRCGVGFYWLDDDQGAFCILAPFLGADDHVQLEEMSPGTYAYPLNDMKIFIRVRDAIQAWSTCVSWGFQPGEEFKADIANQHHLVFKPHEGE